MTPVRTIAVVTAGMGVPSATAKLGTRLGDSVVAALAERDAAATLIPIEVRDLAHEAVNAAFTHIAAPALANALHQVSTADALIAVSPVWNGSYSGLFKLFFDVLDEGALAAKPVLLGATGGTARHSLAIDQAMLPMFWMLKARPVPTPVFAATEEWGQNSGLAARIEAAAHDLADELLVGGVARPNDPFEDVVDFTELLDRH